MKLLLNAALILPLIVFVLPVFADDAMPVAKNPMAMPIAKTDGEPNCRCCKELGYCPCDAETGRCECNLEGKTQEVKKDDDEQYNAIFCRKRRLARQTMRMNQFQAPQPQPMQYNQPMFAMPMYSQPMYGNGCNGGNVRSIPVRSIGYSQPMYAAPMYGNSCNGGGNVQSFYRAAPVYNMQPRFYNQPMYNPQPPVAFTPLSFGSN